MSEQLFIEFTNNAIVYVPTKATSISCSSSSRNEEITDKSKRN